MARRRKSDPFMGLVVLAALAVAALAWFKENVIDRITPQMWVGLAIIVALMIANRIWIGLHRRRQREAEERIAAEDERRRSEEFRRQRAEQLAWGVEKAVLIAKHQKWVSPHRLKTQAHVTDKQAAEFLQFGEMAGLLRQEVNGRYYITPRGFELSIKPINDSTRIIEP